MNILVVYESMYGNTERIARSVGMALGGLGSVEVRAIAGIDRLPGAIDVLVVGGPTYGHGVEASMKDFLDRIPVGALDGVVAAAFDTRVNWPKFLSGAASRGIAERLERKGARLLAPPESFRVEDKDGPLVEGEEARAMTWGRQLLSLVA